MPKNTSAIIAQLSSLVDESKKTRLIPVMEEKGAGLVSELLSAGGKAQELAVTLMEEMPWVMAAEGTARAWPILTVARRRRYLKRLGELRSDSGWRTRLSIARGLFAIDPNAGAEVAIWALVERRQPRGLPSGLDDKDRLAIFQVFVGKNRAWVLDADLSGTDQSGARLIAECVLECTMHASPPSTVALVQWAKPFAGLGDLPVSVQSELAKAYRKWSRRWRKELAKNNPPPIIASALNIDSEPVEGGPSGTARLVGPAIKSPTKNGASHLVDAEIMDLLSRIEENLGALHHDVAQVKSLMAKRCGRDSALG